jgi:hypothetical protein
MACAVATEVFRADEAKDQGPSRAGARNGNSYGLGRQSQPSGRPRPGGLLSPCGSNAIRANASESP